MRSFEFDLRLPDGRIVAGGATAGRWVDAFGQACARAEQEHGLGPWSGIVCVDYRSTPLAPVIPLLADDLVAAAA